MKLAFLVSGLTLVSIISAMQPVLAQGYRNDNPNMRNFYMARQQIQILDDAPAVNDLRTDPSANPAAAAAAAAAGPRPLPRAGFGSYYNPATSMTSGLPQVVNGVPKAPPVPAAPVRRGPVGQRASAKKITPTKAVAAPTTVKAYKPYQTYPSEASSVGASGSSGLNANGNVRGSVLHWNKRRSQQY